MDEEFNSPQDEMVSVIQDEAVAVIAQYAEDRREYSETELYNEILRGGRKGLLLAAIGWLQNELMACDDVDEGECPHRDAVEVCEFCQRLGDVLAKYEEHNDPTLTPEIEIYEREEPIRTAAYQIAQATLWAPPPTPIGQSVILCACGSDLGLTSICKVCLQSICPKCEKEHEPGICGEEA